jgi:peroxiredoxin family protein
LGEGLGVRGQNYSSQHGLGLIFHPISPLFGNAHPFNEFFKSIKLWTTPMKKLVLTTLTAGVLLISATACTSSPSTTEPEASESADSVETAQGGTLTYDETAGGIPVIAQYPDDMEVMAAGSGEGVGVFFTFKPQGNALDDAQVHVFLPAGVSTSADQLPFVTGPNGLMASNGWMEDSVDMDGSEDFPYAWVETVIHFSTDQEQSGHILLGQTDGQAVQVTLLYPAEMADAYWPAAKTVLESLEFDAALLPVTTSESPNATAPANFPEGVSLSDDGQTIVMEQFSNLDVDCMNGDGALAISYMGEGKFDHQVVACGSTYEAFDASRENEFADVTPVAPLVAENALQLQDGEYAQVQCLSDHAGLDPAADSDSEGYMTLNCL